MCCKTSDDKFEENYFSIYWPKIWLKVDNDLRYRRTEFVPNSWKRPPNHCWHPRRPQSCLPLFAFESDLSVEMISGIEVSFGWKCSTFRSNASPLRRASLWGNTQSCSDAIFDWKRCWRKSSHSFRAHILWTNPSLASVRLSWSEWPSMRQVLRLSGTQQSVSSQFSSTLTLNLIQDLIWFDNQISIFCNEVDLALFSTNNVINFDINGKRATLNCPDSMQSSLAE